MDTDVNFSIYEVLNSSGVFTNDASEFELSSEPETLVTGVNLNDSVTYELSSELDIQDDQSTVHCSEERMAVYNFCDDSPPLTRAASVLSEDLYFNTCSNSDTSSSGFPVLSSDIDQRYSDFVTTDSLSFADIHHVKAVVRDTVTLQWPKGEQKVSGCNKFYHRKLTSDDISKARQDCGCRQQCTRQHFYGRSFLRTLRTSYWKRSANERKQFLYDRFTDFHTRKKELEFKLSGRKVCRQAWQQAFGIDKTSLYKAKHEWINKAANPLEHNYRSHATCSRTLEASAWLGNYIALHGESPPHTDNVWLPYGTRKLEVYTKYKEHILEINEMPLSSQGFYNMWRKWYSHVSIKKENLFTKCTICVLLERKLQQKHSPKTRMEIMLQKQRHLRRQMVEKLAYYRRREAAKRRPDRFMSLIVDGMDQAKTYIPHFVGRLSKEIAASIMLKLHVTGVICHGHNLRFTYTDYHQYKHDSNLTMNVLLKVLWEVAKHKSLPPVLYLQADNCFRENKNKYVLGFLELLVRKDIFYEVQMSFLKVGHTHEDVDQMFSTIARTLRTEEASTYPKMLLRLPNGKELRGCFNISKWLEPHLILPHHHTRTSTFRLRKQNDDVDVFYRKNEGQKWRVLKGGFFRKIDNQTSIPSDKPDILIPSLETLDVDGLTQSIDKWAKYFNNSEEIWWQNFVRQLTQIQNNQTTAKQWGRQDAIWYLDDLKKYSLRALEEYEQGPVVGQEIINLLENEEDNPEITVTRRRK